MGIFMRRFLFREEGMTFVDLFIGRETEEPMEVEVDVEVEDMSHFNLEEKCWRRSWGNRTLRSGRHVS